MVSNALPESPTAQRWAPPFWSIPVFAVALVTLLAVAMFVPVKFIHPVRTDRWRSLTLPMALCWVYFAGWAAWVDFDAQSWAHWGLVVTSIYLMVAGAIQQVIYGTDG